MGPCVRTLVVLSAAVIFVTACSGDDDDSASEPMAQMGQDAAAAGEDAAAAGDDGPGAQGVGDNADGVDPLPPLPEDVALPIIFVHGFAGSAQQYESQAMRFVANGYPLERILAFDHDGVGLDIAGYVAGVDAMVDEALATFDVEQVYLVGHSRGTSVSSQYLSDPARAAKVAKYVAIDGRPCPNAVPCVAPTQALHPGQAHVEVATSKESFAMQYEFLVGEPPAVVDIVPQRGPVVLSGRAVNFPANTGREATLDVYEIDSDTGERVGSTPHASFEIGADGEFGPLEVDSSKRYEYVLHGEDSDSQHHIYPQRYLRDSRLMRLLSSPPDGTTRANTNVGDGHASLVVIRMREWYANDDPDNEGDESDILEIGVASDSGDADPINAIVASIGNGTIGLHFHDDAATPGETTLAPLPYFSMQPFQNGIDVYMPAADPPDGTITVTNMPRHDTDRPQTLNVPNWASSRHAISVMFGDYPID